MTIYPIGIGAMTRIAEVFGEFGILFGALIVVLVVAVDAVDDLLERRAARPVTSKRASVAKSNLRRLVHARSA